MERPPKLALTVGLVLLNAVLPSAAQFSPRNFWHLETDAVITIPASRGNTPGTCTLKKGTRVEIVSAAEANPLTLSFAGLIFDMPRGPALQEALDQLYPHRAATDQNVFDVDAWQKRQSLPPEEAKWLPLSPRPNDPRKEQWDPQGIFCLPDNPKIEPAAETEPAADFAWDRTLIIPGRFAYLNLPFILQKKPGICVGAAAINVVRYLSPEQDLTTDELFGMITDRPTSGGLRSLQDAMAQLGIVAEEAQPTRANRASTVQRIKKSLDNNLPVLAADKRHMVLITGYDAKARKLFVWNQWGNGKIINGMPKGHYELEETDLPIEFRTLIFSRKIRYEPADNIKQALEDLAGPSEDLRYHPYFQPRFPFRDYRIVAGGQRIKLALQAGRTVLVPQGGSLLCLMPGDTKAITSVTLPGGAKNTRTLASLAEEIYNTNAGHFFSAKSTEHITTAGLHQTDTMQ